MEEMSPELTEATARHLAKHLADLEAATTLLTPAQAAGRLNVSPGSLAKLNIPRVDLWDSERKIRYTALAIREALEAKTIN